MEELVTIAESSSPLPIRQIVEHIFKKNVELVNLPQEKIDDFISHVFDFISQNRTNCSPRDWEKLRYLLVFMVISLFPTQSKIPPISVHTDYGPLFSILLVLHMIRNDHSDCINYYVQAFDRGLKTFEYGTEVKTFYSISYCYYLQLLPTLLKGNLEPEQFSKLLDHFFNSISRVKPESININFISFTADMFRQITYHLMKHNLLDLCPNFVQSFKDMLTICTSCPNIILLNLLHPWYAFVKHTMDQKQRNVNFNFQEQIEQLTVFYEKVATGKYHELHRGFPWYIAIYFFGLTKGREQQTRVLLLICHAFRSVLRLEGMRGVPEATKEIHSLMISQRNSEGLWALYHILTSCESTLSLGISDLKKIYGVSVNPKIKKNEMKKKTIKFSEQIFEDEINPDIDTEISTKIEELQFPNFESAKEYFSRQVELLFTYRTRVMTGITFQFVFIESVLNDLQSEDIFTSSVAFYYIKKFIKLGIKLMIISAQRITMLEQFYHHEILTNKRSPSKPSTNPNTLLNIPSFSIICKRCMEFTGRIPKQYYSLLANEIAHMLFRALEKGQISYIFIKYFSFLEHNNVFNNNNNNDISPQDTLYAHVFCKLMEITSSRLNDFLSHSSTKSKLIFSWVLLIIRIGRLNENSNSCLKVFLKTFYKLIFNTISHLKKTSNQAYVLKMLRIYMNVMSSEYNRNKFFRFRSIQRIYDEIQIFAKKESLSTLLHITIPENNAVNVPSLLALLDASLSSDDPELVKNASDFCLALFNLEKPIDSNNCLTLQLFKSWFKSTNILPPNEALKIVERLPEYSSCFNQPAIPPSHVQINMMHDDTGFNLIPILNEIAFNMNDDHDEIANLFILVVDCFEILKQKIHQRANNIKESMKKLLFYLCYCSNFEFLKEKVNTFSSDLINYFLDIFAKGESSLFLISLISVSGINRSESSKFASLLCITFLERAQKMNLNVELFKSTIDEMMGFFTPQVRLYSTLNGLSLFTRFYPESVSMNIMRTFLISSNEFDIFDIEFTAILNKMLKQFLRSKSRDEQTEFVLMSYDILSRTLLNSSLILLKRLDKLGISLPISNCNDILENAEDMNGNDPVDPLIVFQKLSAVLVCGIEGPIILSEKIKQMINNFIKSKNDALNLVELSRKMSLYMSIIRSPDTFKNLSTDPGFIKNVLSFFVNTLSSRFSIIRKNATKAFRILVTKYNDEFYTSRQIEVYCSNPSMIFKFFSPQQDRIAFYRRLTKIIPQKIPPKIAHEFLEAIFEYVDFDDSKKFALVSNLLHFVKYLTIESFIKLEEVQAIILSPYKYDETCQLTYLQTYIEKILILYQHREVPFYSIIHKYVMRFLLMFPVETVEFIAQLPPKSDSKIAYEFLTDLIEKDDTLLFFNTLISYIDAKKEAILNVNHPSFFFILVKLSKIPKFAELKLFQATLDGLLAAFINSTIHLDPSKRGTRIYTIIMDIGYAEVNTFKTSPSIERLFKFTQVFNLPSMMNTHLYRRYVTIIFKKGNQEFISEIVQFIMKTKPKITPKVFGILLGHSLKYLDHFDEEILITLWDFLSNKISLNQTNLAEPILICIIRLLRKNVPQRQALNKILTAIQFSISSPETHIVLYSIKLACELVQANLMPPPLYFQMVRQIFSYSKFFDLPYSKYTYKFLKMSKRFKTIPKEFENSVIETISFFPHDKFASIREMKRFIDIFTEVPQFLIGIPFSLISTLALYLEANLKKKTKDEIVEIDPLLISGLKFCSIVKPSQAEICRFTKTCFLFFTFLVNQSLMMKEFPDTFFEYILKNGCQEFPIDLLKLVIQSPSLNNNYRFGFLCCASKFIPEELSKEEYIEIIESLLQFAKEPTQNINNHYLITLLEFINSKSGLIKRFYPTVSEIVYAWIEMQSLTESTRDRFILFCNSLILLAPDQEKLSHLMKIWQLVLGLPNIPTNNILISSLFRFIISTLINIPMNLQAKYLSFMVENVVNNPQHCFFFISVLPILFNSEKVTNEAKKQLLASLSCVFTKVSAEPFEEIIESISNYGQKAKINVNMFISIILLSQCKFTSHAKRLIYFRRIMDLIPNIKFEEFIVNLPLVFWSNEYLAITTALITPDEWPIWRSIFAFSNRLEKISDQLAAASLDKLVTSDNFPQVCSFFSSLLTAKPSHQYSHISIALLQCFYLKGLFVSTTIAEKAVKYQDVQVLFPEFLNDTIPSQIFLAPHILNDSIFGHFLNSLNINEASAIALTFLNEYQAAESVYKNTCSSNHPLFSAVMQINSHFTSIYKCEPSLESLLKPLCPVNQENDAILIKINEAVKSFLRKEEASLGILFEAETMNMKNLQKHRTLSNFEREKIATIEYTIRCIKRHFQNLKNLRPLFEFEKAVSPVFFLSLSSIVNLLEGSPQFQVPSIAFDNDGAVLLDPSLVEDIPCVSAITSRGLIVVGKSQIDSYLLTMSLKISENQITAADWCKFAHFSFNVFLAQPSIDLFQVTFGVYSQIILMSQSSDDEILPFIKTEAAARIITLIRIAIESSNADMAMMVTTNSAMFKREFFEIWKPWLVQIIDLAKSNWFCSIVSEIAKEAMYKSYLYCEKLGCKRIAESLNPRLDPITPLAAMISLENCFDNIFLKIDFHRLYREVVLGEKAKEALEFKNSRYIPQTFFEYASTQVEIDEFNDRNKTNHVGDNFNSETTNPSLNEIDKMSLIVRDINNLLPITNPPSVLYKVYEDLRMVSPNLVIFYATTSNSSREAFLIQRSHNYDKNGYSTSIVTLSNISLILKRLFNTCYQSHIRSINLNVSPHLEVGHKYTIIPLGDAGHNICASTLFASKIKMTHQKWLHCKLKREKEESLFDNYDRAAQELNVNLDVASSTTDPLLVRLSSSINTQSPILQNQFDEFSLPQSALLEYITSIVTISDFIRARPLLLRCLTAKACFKYIFNAPYPKLEGIYFPTNRITAPILISDFEERFFTGISQSLFSNDPNLGNDKYFEILTNESSFRLSPNFRTLFGPRYRGEFLISFAASMKALSSRLEILRACFEILVADPSVGNGGVTPSNLLMNRNKLEEKLLEISPPTGAMANEEDCIKWFDKIMCLIKQSENPEIQNPYAIPWF